MKRSKTLWSNQDKLSRKVRRAQANLYLTRSGLDTINQETIDTINEDRSIIEREQFSSSTILNPNTASEPTTPPYSSDSSSDEENFPIDDNSNNFPMSDDEESKDVEREERRKDNQAAVDNSAKLPLRGFSGQLLTDESSKVNALHLTQGKKVHIYDDSDLSWDGLKKFREQCKQTDTTVEIMHVVSKIAFELIIRTAMANITGDSQEDIERLSELSDLYRFTQRDHDEHVLLDNTVWNTQTFCRLLEDTFPKDRSKLTRGVDDFHILVKAVPPNYDYDDVLVEIETLRAIRILVTNYGDSRISLRDEELAVQTWIKMWSKATQDNFKAFVGSGSLKRIDEFTTQLQRWTARGRKSGADASLAGYGVSVSKQTCFYGGGKFDQTPKIVGGTKRDNFNGPNNSGSGTAYERPTKKVNLQDDNARYSAKMSNPQEILCNHCGRLKHDGLCPFISYHKDVNKDANIAFADSARGKEYKASLGYNFLHPVKQADKGRAQPPAEFVSPPAPTATGGSGSFGKGASRDKASEGKSYKGNAPTVVTMATADILTYLTALVSMNTNSDLLPCLISLPSQCQVAR